mmetsp:Transcript_32228/g.56581  ORF Transcript_32228/g.56581 Transcript_32228/m.56581 type:complete len:343 (-) Transcript_32228:475-1503(-)
MMVRDVIIGDRPTCVFLLFLSKHIGRGCVLCLLFDCKRVLEVLARRLVDYGPLRLRSDGFVAFGRVRDAFPGLERGSCWGSKAGLDRRGSQPLCGFLALHENVHALDQLILVHMVGHDNSGVQRLFAHEASAEVESAHRSAGLARVLEVEQNNLVQLDLVLVGGRHALNVLFLEDGLLPGVLFLQLLALAGQVEQRHADRHGLRDRARQSLGVVSLALAYVAHEVLGSDVDRPDGVRLALGVLVGVQHRNPRVVLGQQHSHHALAVERRQVVQVPGEPDPAERGPRRHRKHTLVDELVLVDVQQPVLQRAVDREDDREQVVVSAHTDDRAGQRLDVQLQSAV